MQELLNEIQNLPGFKISNSHFRIGSKLHISEFYYAKRFFQNSFFASRFAYMLTQEILKDLGPEKREAIRKKGLTLVGYGLYSELLLSLTGKFLRSAPALDTPKINHNLIWDTEKLELIKKPDFRAYIIIVVPIASTFSTSIKIESALNSILTEKKTSATILAPHYNLLHICDNQESDRPSPIEEEFGWIAKIPAKKEVKIKAYFENDISTEKIERYFLSLPTRWQMIHDCSNCFPVERSEPGEVRLLEEKPLFDTDKTSVTPNIIFDFPKGREIPQAELDRGIILKPDMVRYGHHKRNDHHFIYSIDTELFLQANLEKVTRWLSELKRLPDFATQFPEFKHVLIVSSCHYSNAAFINLVNEILFSSAANIIHYDPANDYIQNFEMIYGSEIEAAEKILFVDDSLKSAKTFFKIDDFIKQTLQARGWQAKKISTCLLLLNKAQSFTIEKVMEKLVERKAKPEGVIADEMFEGRIHAFGNMNLFTSLSHDEESSLILEETRYKLLIKESLLDSLKVHFHRQLMKLSTKKEHKAGDVKAERHLAMLEATHRVYQYFSSATTERQDVLDIDKFLGALWSDTKSPVRHEYKYGFREEGLSPFQAALLKVLTQSPFTQHEPLRRIAFNCVINLLDRHVKTTSEHILKGSFSYKHFQDLKFLIRRAGLLNSNYLISEKFIDFIRELYSPQGLPRLMHQIKNMEGSEPDLKGELFDVEFSEPTSSRKRNLQDFPVFYCAQIKELLLQNEARSRRLELLLKHKENGPRAYLQILRVLREENAVLIRKAVESITEIEEWRNLRINYYQNGNEIRGFLELPKVKLHHKFKLLKEFLKDTELDDPQIIEFFLVLKHFLSFEKSEVGEHVPLIRKTEFIYDKLSAIFRFCSSKVNNHIGFFLIVRDSEHKATLVMERNEEEPYRAELNRYTWNNEDDAFFADFLNGIKDDTDSYCKTFIELSRNREMLCWEDMYSPQPSVRVKLSYNVFSEEINRVLLMRLNTRATDAEEEVQGVIGFYFKSNNNAPNLNIARLLLLLRDSLSSFVEKHHQNNEFRDWQLAENTRQLALLSGHGKDMMRRLSDNDRCLKIALHLENLQTFVLLNELHRKNASYDDLIDQFNSFYHAKGNKDVNAEYMTSVEELAQFIYNSPEIENVVDCKLVVKFSPGLSFAFDRRILDLILFELFVNAKKNRWYFLKGETIEGYSKNTLEVSFFQLKEEGRSLLQIIVKNTGPYFSDNSGFHRLNDRRNNVKPDDVIAGTALIKTIVLDILKGRISFSRGYICNKNQFGEFTVTITVEEMYE